MTDRGYDSHMSGKHEQDFNDGSRSSNSMKIRIYHMFNSAAKGFDSYMKLAKQAPDGLQDDFLKLAEGELKECMDNMEIYTEFTTMEGTSSRASGSMHETMMKEIERMEQKFENYDN